MVEPRRLSVGAGASPLIGAHDGEDADGLERIGRILRACGHVEIVVDPMYAGVGYTWLRQLSRRTSHG